VGAVVEWLQPFIKGSHAQPDLGGDFRHCYLSTMCRKGILPSHCVVGFIFLEVIIWQGRLTINFITANNGSKYVMHISKAYLVYVSDAENPDILCITKHHLIQTMSMIQK